jgi:hypothetical protein
VRTRLGVDSESVTLRALAALSETLFCAAVVLVSRACTCGAAGPHAPVVQALESGVWAGWLRRTCVVCLRALACSAPCHAQLVAVSDLGRDEWVSG